MILGFKERYGRVQGAKTYIRTMKTLKTRGRREANVDV